jgi:hypothetical protein
MTLLLRRRGLHLLLAALFLGGLASASQAPIQGAAPFADAAFERVWQRTDALVAQGAVSRTWLWGPEPGLSLREPWADSPGGARLVQYYDKGRMEINNPGAPAADPFFVTNGLLATELISGQLQLGPAQFTARAPADIPLAGDRDDPTAPTYASFNRVASFPGADRRVPDASGQPVNQTIARDGTVQPLAPPHPDYGVRVAYYDETTGHNVPDVFWTFLNGPGTVLENGQVAPRRLFDPWYGLVGLPISEAYWAYVKIGGGYADVLIQAFQRRVLTYAPNNPEGFKVEMGNIGLHYQEWRYGTSGGGSQPTPVPPVASRPPPPDVRIQAITNQQVGLNLNSQSVTMINATQGPVDMTGWRLVAPKNDHEEVYQIPRFTLAAGATVSAYAGWGNGSDTQLYMSRITWFFDGTPNDGVLLYDAFGQEVARYFLSGGAGPTPLPGGTPPPQPTAAIPPTNTPQPGTTPPAGGTPKPTSTVPLPTPELTGQPTVATATRTPRPGPSATPTPSAFPTGTPTPQVYGDGTRISAWVNNQAPRAGETVRLTVLMTFNNQPVVNGGVDTRWDYPTETTNCSGATDGNGVLICDQVILPDAAGMRVWIDVTATRPDPQTSVYTTTTTLLVQR